MHLETCCLWFDNLKKIDFKYKPDAIHTPTVSMQKVPFHGTTSN